MDEAIPFLSEWGLALVFFWAMLEQAGLPLPATPLFVGVGALAGMGRMNGWAGFGAAVLGAAMGDWVWYLLGRWYGRRGLGLLCRLWRQPPARLERAEACFLRHGKGALVFSKFLPGAGLLVRPLAGAAGIDAFTFFVCSAVGTGLYVIPFMGLGYCFSGQTQALAVRLSAAGHSAFCLLAAAGLVWAWRRWLRRQAQARVMPACAPPPP